MLPPVHFSRLRLIARSPAHYAYATAEETPSLERGTAVHALVFETQRIVSWEEGRPRRGKDYDKFVADNPNALILTHVEGQKALAMAEAVRRCREAMRVLDGTRETLREWDLGGRACAGTPDVVSRQFVTELKTTVSSHPERFAWQSLRMAYHAQLAWYLDGVMKGGQLAPENAYVVAVESTAPFPVTVFRVSNRAIEEGRKLYRLWWEQLMNCERSDEWPAYAQSVLELDIPGDVALDFGDAEAA